MSQINFKRVIEGKNALEKKRREIEVLMGIILGVYHPNKKYLEFKKSEGQTINIPDKDSGHWVIYCVNSTSVSGISRIEYIEIKNFIAQTKKPLAVFTLGSAIFKDSCVRKIHSGLQKLLDGFIQEFPETEDLFCMYVDEAAYP